MIVKILGVLDIFIAVCFWIFGLFGFIHSSFILVLGLFLLFKGAVFSIQGMNFICVLDLFFAFVIILSTAPTITLPSFMVIISSLFLLQKGFFSLIG